MVERTDEAGPVFARSEIDVSASPKRVWAVLAQIEQWPTWNPAVRSSSLDGALEADSSFRWAAGPGTNSCVLSDVDAPRILAWHGRSMGISHQQAWHLEPRTGGCHVTVEQAMSGLLARILSGRLQQRLQGDLDTWVRLLKLEAEERSSDDDAAGAAETSPAPMGKSGGTDSGPSGGAAS
ncbi:MAG: SRPBCC family protein [Chloroflexota bacterium]